MKKIEIQTGEAAFCELVGDTVRLTTLDGTEVTIYQTEDGTMQIHSAKGSLAITVYSANTIDVSLKETL